MEIKIRNAFVLNRRVGLHAIDATPARRRGDVGSSPRHTGWFAHRFGFFFCEGPVTCFREATASDTDKFARWHRGMLERGVYLAPSQYEAGFMSLAHTEEDVDKTIAAAKEVFATI